MIPILPLLVLFHSTYGADSVLWRNNDFPVDDPLKNFHPQEHGFFNYGSLTASKDPAGGHQNVLRVFYKKGTYSQIRGLKGAQFYSQPSSTHTAMTLSYQVYFSHGFDFVKGGKLPGLYGGAIATCSGGRHSTSCFSARLMWREHGDGEIYTYIPDQPSSFCDRSDIACSPAKGTSLGRGKWRFPTGKWIKITEHVHLNTVGKNDGFAKIWIDGKLVMNTKDIVWRVKDNIKINGIFFSTFFGGATKEWGAKKDCYSYFKDFVLSMGASVPPLLG
ncbi:hypothetical protein LOTGIDRAFT_231062 [Lottia gigantea]|uniref:Polysaccharide lyase 14 domain-containing protein n=1 Tax=Lottia gigantea TaxID=225164 RepID=V4AWM0_LOTGI|nr:hypothetical protein LOTGIDRAFT_231062 [Lottia gigantea]ESO99400.1 hypothetical protein LOTGIDRAFT_231062 [Lottia gigantea]